MEAIIGWIPIFMRISWGILQVNQEEVRGAFPPDTGLFSSDRPDRGHIDGEAVFHVRLQQALISFVDFLDRNHFHV